MKLAILGSRGIPARYGGFETFAERLAIGLCENGFDVTVFCERRGCDEPEVYKSVKLRHVTARLPGVLQCGFATNEFTLPGFDEFTGRVFNDGSYLRLSGRDGFT